MLLGIALVKFIYLLVYLSSATSILYSIYKYDILHSVLFMHLLLFVLHTHDETRLLLQHTSHDKESCFKSTGFQIAIIVF